MLKTKEIKTLKIDKSHFSEYYFSNYESIAIQYISQQSIFWIVGMDKFKEKPIYLMNQNISSKAIQSTTP